MAFDAGHHQTRNSRCLAPTLSASSGSPSTVASSLSASLAACIIDTKLCDLIRPIVCCALQACGDETNPHACALSRAVIARDGFRSFEVAAHPGTCKRRRLLFRHAQSAQSQPFNSGSAGNRKFKLVITRCFVHNELLPTERATSGSANDALLWIGGSTSAYIPVIGLNRPICARSNAVARRVNSRPRRTILHNESRDGKRFLCQLGGDLEMSGQKRLLGRSQVRQLERKKEMKPNIGHRALRPTNDLIDALAGIKGLREPIRTLAASPACNAPVAFSSD